MAISITGQPLRLERLGRLILLAPGYSDINNWPFSSPVSANDFANLDIALGGDGIHATSADSVQNWQHGGLFKGVFSGLRWGDFDKQSEQSYIWSSSIFTDSSDGALAINFNKDEVYIGDGSGREYGFAIRCLLK
jgi:hypothetical protein